MTTRRTRRLRAYRRFIDAIHEIGLLLIALAPLDYAIDQRPMKETWRPLVIFLAIGAACLTLSILMEWSFPDE
jgi:hypothetical protein